MANKLLVNDKIVDLIEMRHRSLISSLCGISINIGAGVCDSIRTWMLVAILIGSHGNPAA